MIVNKEECEFDSMVSTYNSLSNAPNNPHLPQPFIINWL